MNKQLQTLDDLRLYEAQLEQAIDELKPKARMLVKLAGDLSECKRSIAQMSEVDRIKKFK